jgi:hypothetical protein
MIVPTGWLASLCCSDCGTTAAMITVNPGSLSPTGAAAQREIQGWCRECATRRGWLGEVKDVAA